MKSTKDEIIDLKVKLKSIDDAFDSSHAWEVSRKQELRKRAGLLEKEIKRLEDLDGLSGNTLHESLSLLARMLVTMDEYCHIEDEVTDVRAVIQAKYDELDAELQRRYAEDDYNANV